MGNQPGVSIDLIVTLLVWLVYLDQSKKSPGNMVTNVIIDNTI